MAKEKLSNMQKKAVKTLNPKGKKQINAMSNLLNVSPSTTYKAKREGELLNQIDELKAQNDALDEMNRRLVVQNELLKMMSKPKEVKKSSRYS